MISIDDLTTDLLAFDDQGWFDEPNRKILTKFFHSNQIETIIELGSWKGKSALFMAELLPMHGKIYCVDTWEGFLAESKKTPFSNYEREKSTLYDQFLSNVLHKNLMHKVIPLRKKTSEAAKSLAIQADLIYIDASHDEKSVLEDIYNYFPKLKPNGILCGDDYGRFPGVTEAVHKAALKLGKKLKFQTPFWWFEEFSQKMY